MKVQLGWRYVTAWCIATLETNQLLEQQNSHKYLHTLNHEENEFQTWKIAEKMKQLCKLFSKLSGARSFFPAKVIASNAST